MRAIHVGICHDDDFFVPDFIGVVVRARATAQSLNQIMQLLITA